MNTKDAGTLYVILYKHVIKSHLICASDVRCKRATLATAMAASYEPCEIWIFKFTSETSRDCECTLGD